MAIVRFKQGRDIEASGLGGRDQLKQRAQLLSVECVEPVKIVPANACQQPHHHRQVSGTDGACGAGMRLWHRGSPVSGMSPICATFHLSCQSCKITRTAEHPQTCQTCRSAARCQTGTPFGAAQSIASRPKPGFRKEARLWAGKKARDEPPCVSHGIAPISPAIRAAPGGCVPGVSDERPDLPKPKPRAPQSPCLQPRRSPRPGPRTLPRARFANRAGPALFYIWAENPGNDFGGLSVAKSSKNQ